MRREKDMTQQIKARLGKMTMDTDSLGSHSAASSSSSCSHTSNCGTTSKPTVSFLFYILFFKGF